MIRNGGISFLSVPDSPNSVTDIKPFKLPQINLTSANKQRAVVPLRIDDSIRNVDVVTSLAFKTGKCKRAVKEVESQALAGKRMDKLNQGMFVVVNL